MCFTIVVGRKGALESILQLSFCVWKLHVPPKSFPTPYTKKTCSKWRKCATRRVRWPLTVSWGLLGRFSVCDRAPLQLCSRFHLPFLFFCFCYVCAKAKRQKCFVCGDLSKRKSGFFAKISQCEKKNTPFEGQLHQKAQWGKEGGVDGSSLAKWRSVVNSPPKGVIR